jgi:hypothetical protein
LDTQRRAAGERGAVVQPKLAARVGLLATGASNANDPNGAGSGAVTGLQQAEVKAT